MTYRQTGNARIAAWPKPILKWSRFKPLREATPARVVKIGYSKLMIAVSVQPVRLHIADDAADQVLSANNVASDAIFRSRIAMPVRVALGTDLDGSWPYNLPFL
jgi:hypothetical protein